ncbi:MAG: hypothetical protein IJ448_02820 [Oscillospiraceae bacterium]|nr:hypothetical protein [Oscillospiraceae bacterium]
MKFITVKEAAQKWGVTTRRVQDLCKQGRIPGAQRWERSWMLPEQAVYPAHKSAAQGPYNLPMPRKSPFLDMTDLYHTPGTAEQCIAALQNQPEAQMLFAAEIAYHRGEIDLVYEHAQTILSSYSGFYSVIAGGMLLALCAMWRGDIQLWNQAKMHICAAPCNSREDQEILALSLAAVGLRILDTRGFPEWFMRGSFTALPADAHPSAKVYYIQYLLYCAHEIALDKIVLDGVSGLGSMRTMPYILEPFITQAIVDKTVMVELFLRLQCACAYQRSGDMARATYHMDRAIALALPDRLLGPLVEHRRQLGYLLDDRLNLVSPETLRQIKALEKQQHQGWVKLHNHVLQKNVSGTLSVREREVARLAAFGLSDAQIAEQLMLSKATVKSLISMAKNKTGAQKRAELAIYI